MILKWLIEAQAISIINQLYHIFSFSSKFAFILLCILLIFGRSIILRPIRIGHPIVTSI
jgi:hypothetical protein